MPIDDVARDIEEINRNVCDSLWNTADTKDTPPTGLSPRLIFPQKRSKDVRVSEQEARVLCCRYLESSKEPGYHYSVETPTEQLYSFSGTKLLSARSDMSLWLHNGGSFNKKANIEFKAHNAAPASIQKDVKKLICEGAQGIQGNWFHLIEKSDNRTIPALLRKFRKAFINLKHVPCGKDGSAASQQPVSILFCICVLGYEKMYEKKLGSQVAYLKHFDYNPLEHDSFVTYVEDIFGKDTEDKENKKDRENRIELLKQIWTRYPK
jgi:hypothetical protein